VMQQMGIDEEEVERRKAWLEFGTDDIHGLQAVDEVAQRNADEIIQEFYAHLLRFDEARGFFKDARVLENVLRLTQGNYDLAYVQARLNIGLVHERIGLPVKFYLGMYNFYLRAIGKRLLDQFQGDPEKLLTVFFSLTKLTFLDISLAIDTYIASRERTIRAQQDAIRELSTPVLPVREGLLILPIVGTIDSQRARQLTENLLNAIRSNRAKVVVMDITGVPNVDTKVANHLVQAVEASRLMGAKVIITGLSPEIAHTLVTIGVDLNKIDTVGDLRGGLEEAERLLGYEVTQPAARSARKSPAPER
jgi:rsbT co-antagonist protein RsbR